MYNQQPLTDEEFDDLFEGRMDHCKSNTWADLTPRMRSLSRLLRMMGYPRRNISGESGGVTQKTARSRETVILTPHRYHDNCYSRLHTTRATCLVKNFRAFPFRYRRQVNTCTREMKS